MGVTPMAGAAAAICAAASTLIALCSMSMNSQSKPQVAAADAMSTVRAWRRPRPSARRPSFSRCLARLGCMARSLWNYEDLRYNGFRYITGCVIRMKRNHSHPGIVLLEQFLKRSEEHTSELQSPCNLVCRLLLEKKKSSEGRYRMTACASTARSTREADHAPVVSCYLADTPSSLVARTHGAVRSRPSSPTAVSRC